MNKRIISNAKAPCLNCKKRRLYCHKDCEDYIAFTKDNAELRKRKSEYNISFREMYNDMVKDSVK